MKIGQQSLDQEFMASQDAGLFINTMMGWPVLPSADLYAGGPAYPLSSLGVRLRAHPTGAITVLAGVFDDNPPGGPFDDDQQLRGAERSGTQLQPRHRRAVHRRDAVRHQPARRRRSSTTGSSTAGLPGTYKLGAWFDTASFPDQRFDNTGLSLADPASTGIAQPASAQLQPLCRRGPDGLAAGPARAAIGRRLRPRRWARPTDRNLIDFSVNAGADPEGAAARPRQRHVRHRLRRRQGQRRASAARPGHRVLLGRLPGPRAAETFIEVTYQVQLAPWWQVQPDFQYVFMPGGGIPNPSNPPRRIGNEAVFGLRTNITF